MDTSMLSVGIDIGTSTTSMVVSRLNVQNTASCFTVPRVAITGAEIVYRGEIYQTPQAGGDRIDADAVAALLAEEYRRAGITPEQVQTGAVIITGESSRKENAALVTQRMSSLAGEFVVATAGPDLESIIAAKGAGTAQYDMYPQYWTTSIGGIFMKYSYEYKRMCVDLYRRGQWPETPPGAKEKKYHDMIREWVRMEDACGPEALQRRSQNREWTPDQKYELVAKVLAGASIKETAICAGINNGLLYQWVRRYRIEGYEGLAAQRKGRPPKEPEMKKKVLPAELTPSEREEMIRLKAENERLRAENAVIKKEIALREERCAAQLKARKRRSSKNSEKKDTL